jgi:hypothetical protein
MRPQRENGVIVVTGSRADRQKDSAAFRKRFGELRARYERKLSLQERFDQAGLPS